MVRETIRWDVWGELCVRAGARAQAGTLRHGGRARRRASHVEALQAYAASVVAGLREARRTLDAVMEDGVPMVVALARPVQARTHMHRPVERVATASAKAPIRAIRPSQPTPPWGEIAVG